MKHGMFGTRFYQIWCGIKQRCLYKKHNRYKNYGGRGIKICNKWLDFTGFQEDMYESYKNSCKIIGEENISIDRIDTNENYTKKNCKWSSPTEQAQNRTNNHLLKFNGEIKTISQWEKLLGFKRGLIQGRLNRDWPVEDVLSKKRWTVMKKRKLTDEHKRKIQESMLKHFKTNK